LEVKICHFEVLIASSLNDILSPRHLPAIATDSMDAGGRATHGAVVEINNEKAADFGPKMRVHDSFRGSLELTAVFYIDAAAAVLLAQRPDCLYQAGVGGTLG